MVGYLVDAFSCEGLATKGIFLASGLDLLLSILTFIILQSFKSFESVLLLMLAYVGQLFMLHSCDLVSFYVCLEAQNFCFLVLCGLQPNTITSTKKDIYGRLAAQSALVIVGRLPAASPRAAATHLNLLSVKSGGWGFQPITSSARARGALSQEAAAKLNTPTYVANHSVNAQQNHGLASGLSGIYNNVTPSTYFNNRSALFSVEASIKYLLLSAFSSGVILY